MKQYPPRRSRARGFLVPLAMAWALASGCTTDASHDTSPSPSRGTGVGQALPPPDDAALQELADAYRLESPPQNVEFERYISTEEYSAVMVPCLTEQGIPVTATSDDGVRFDDIPEEQWPLQAEAMYRCSVRFPTHPMFDEPLDDDQLRRLYDYKVGDLTACLEDEGYAPAPPPTVEVFIASYSDPGAAMWTPWPVDDPRLLDMAEWDRLNEVCPQSPPLEYLYGDALSPDGG